MRSNSIISLISWYQDRKIRAMKSNFLKIFVVMSAVGIFLSLPARTEAASAFFDTLPEKNPIGVGSETDVNVFLNTNGNNITLARIVLTYDPAIVQVTDAKYSDLFCTYPDDEESFFVDNDEGIVKVSGFCETDPVTTTDFELFVKITFKGRKAGTTNIQAAFSTAGGLNETAVYDDKSPPQNVLTTTPSKISFGVGSTGDIPGTAIDRSWLFYVSLVVFALGVSTFLYLKYKQNKTAIKN